MMDWAVLDCSNLVWRMFYSIGQRDPIASIVSFVLDIPKLVDQVQASSVVFACDHPPYKRNEIWPSYKRSRITSNIIASSQLKMRSHIAKLPDYLELLGYQNVFHQPGYEADDIMAMVATSIPEPDRVILVTSDTDLYQCLNKRVAVYHPRLPPQFVTSRWFRSYYKIKPDLWAQWRCLVGCQTDCIPGMPRVSSETGMRFFRGELKGTLLHAKILEFNRSADYTRNWKLIALPMPGMASISPVQQSSYPPSGGYSALAEKLGISIPQPLRQPCRV